MDKPASAADGDAEIRFLDQAEFDALLAVPAPRRHSKRTLERAVKARALRDQEHLQWKEIGDALECSAATAMYLYRATADVAGDEDLWRVGLAMYLTASMSGSGKVSCWHSGGGMSTGLRGRSGSAAGCGTASDGPRSRLPRRGPFRWRTGSAARSTGCSRPRRIKATTTSYSGTRTRAVRSTAARVYTHYAPTPNEVDLVNDAFDPQLSV